MEHNDTYRSILSSIDRKIYGTTIYIGRNEITTIYGDFTCFTFQDLIHKGYIIALCHGDLNAEILFTRMHSSCVTSETMRSLDCDCVSQLYGALKKIAENNGILFYLIQEGRGCGYVGKSRACMNVQYYEGTEDEINTFQAYESLGMVHDYRQYNNVKEILHLMDLDPKFVLLTNNPDKIEKFKSLNINLDRVESIEITPNPFNQQYLHSKEEYGHILYQAKKKVSKYNIPHETVKPFNPYALKSVKRFIHVSSYYLPIKPTWGRIVLRPSEYALLCSKYPDQDFSYQILDNEAYYVKVNEQILNENAELLCKPYWFKVNVFYDIVTHNDYLILEYGMEESNNKVPIIRIHSESIFNRFPLTDRLYKYRYKRSLEYIVRNGKGAILILYHDGRGSGLGYYVLNSQRDERSELTNSAEYHQMLGVEEDRRDYHGALTLLNTFTLEKSESEQIDVIHGDTSYDTLKSKMDEHNISVRHWIDVNLETDLFGYESIYSRICQTPRVLTRLEDSLERIREVFANNRYESNTRYLVSGIGSSESHAKYVVHSLQDTVNIRYISVLDTDESTLMSGKTVLILFSQGFTYNVAPLVDAMNGDNIILITTYTGGDPKRDGMYNKLRESETSKIIHYSPEVPDDTLIRITGPFCAYVLAEEIICTVKREPGVELEQVLRTVGSNRGELPYDFITSIGNSSNLTLILPDDMYEYHKDISNRFIEGAFLNVNTCKTSEFSHGYYQQSVSDPSNVILVVKSTNNELQERLETLLEGTNGFSVDLSRYDRIISVLVLMIVLNNAIYQIMQRKSINQRDWPGKDKQQLMYEVMSI